MPQRHSALDYQELYEELKKQFFTENNMEKKQPDFNDEPYKTDGEGNELTVYDCLNRKERRKLMRERMRMEKKNRRDLFYKTNLIDLQEADEKKGGTK